jgi:hypothetical protein
MTSAEDTTSNVSISQFPAPKGNFRESCEKG